MEGGKCIEAEATAGDAQDEGMGFGQRETFAGGKPPLVNEVVGQATEAKDGQGHGELTLEGVDAAPEFGKGVHEAFS